MRTGAYLNRRRPLCLDFERRNRDSISFVGQGITTWVGLTVLPGLRRETQRVLMGEHTPIGQDQAGAGLLSSQFSGHCCDSLRGG